MRRANLVFITALLLLVTSPANEVAADDEGAETTTPLLVEVLRQGVDR